jgi:hypothetical protein
MKDIPIIEKGRFRSLAFFTFNFLLMDCATLVVVRCVYDLVMFLLRLWYGFLNVIRCCDRYLCSLDFSWVGRKWKDNLWNLIRWLKEIVVKNSVQIQWVSDYTFSPGFHQRYYLTTTWFIKFTNVNDPSSLCWSGKPECFDEICSDHHHMSLHETFRNHRKFYIGPIIDFIDTPFDPLSPQWQRLSSACRQPWTSPAWKLKSRRRRPSSTSCVSAADRWTNWKELPELTLGARSHNLIEILKYYCKEIGALFTIILTKLFKRFLKYFYSIFLQNIQKLYDQIILIKKIVCFYKNIDKVFEKVCKSYCK